MSPLNRDIVFLALQFLHEEGYKKSAHRLEQESGFFFNMQYFEEMVMNGDWDDVEKYLSGFTKFEDNRYSMILFFTIRKQKYLEALDKKEHAKALEILAKDLKVFYAHNEDLFKQLIQLSTLENIREQLSTYGDTKSARRVTLGELRKLIEENPLFYDKINFPSMKSSRLHTLINHSLSWQHQSCENPKPNPETKTLFVDHSCGQSQPNSTQTPSLVTNPLMGSVLWPAGFPTLGAHVPFQPSPAPLSTSLAGWMANPSTVPYLSLSAGCIGFTSPNNAALLRLPRTTPTNNPTIDYQTTDSGRAFKRPRTFGISDEANHMSLNISSVGCIGQSRRQSSYSSDELPKAVVMTLNQGSVVKSMNFHPLKQILLLVGGSNGEIIIWDLVSREKLAYRNFKVWDLSVCSVPLQASLACDNTATINRVTWSLDGKMFGVAYSKHIVQIYSYHGGDDIRNHLEIDAHGGSVNDISFAYTNTLCIVTCGEDRLIKVWDAVTGANMHTFEGHEAPVYSVCPYFKENLPYIFSTAIDGKIKLWMYDDNGSRVDYTAPGRSPTKMAYSADGRRLFSCGTNKGGESYMVEWNDSDGTVKRAYKGLGKRSVEVVQFDTTKNRFLVVGDESMVKFWHVNNTNIFTTTYADGGLPASPCVRFNKGGMFLAVSTNENGIKILANQDGINLLMLRTAETPMFGAANTSAGPSIMDRVTPMPSMAVTNSDNRSPIKVKPRTGEEAMEKSEITEITEPEQCRSLRLPDDISSAIRVSRLDYTKSGLGILALAANAVHKLWKWQTGTATANVIPQLWQPKSGILMTNDISDTNPEGAVPCFTLSKTSYCASTSGGKISLFNMVTFKTVTTFMSPPPAATFLAFYPQDNNIIAVGMEDSLIQIYNVRINEVKARLKGHHKRISGLTFSDVLDVLVSSGADSQLCVWNTDGWNQQTSKHLQIPTVRVGAPLVDTRVQFHKDQTHLLAVHETQIAVYEAPKLESPKQWFPPETSGLIIDATYSCDSQSIFVCFEDKRVGILTASTLMLRCRISSTAYLPSNPNLSVYPLVIAAHPTDADQFALGLSDGSVFVLEPLDPEQNWGPLPPQEHGAGPSNTTTGVY